MNSEMIRDVDMCPAHPASQFVVTTIPIIQANTGMQFLPPPVTVRCNCDDRALALRAEKAYREGTMEVRPYAEYRARRLGWLRSWIGRLLLLLLAAPLFAADKYVSPSGSGSTCSLASPGPLASALSSNACGLAAGDTLWLRAGTYSGTFTSNLAGTSANPIKVRNYNGERATLDGGTSSAPVLSTGGKYTWYWGFEIKDTNTKRVTSQSGSWPTDISLGDGVNTTQGAGDVVGLKFINLIIHDVRQGISWWVEAKDSEVNGCIIYYVGWDAPDRGHGHGIYTQNQTGTKTLKDSFVFQQYGGNVHAYGSDNAFLNNFWVEGNTVFEGGSLAAGGTNDNLLIGGGVVLQNATIKDNVGNYDTSGDWPTCAFNIGGWNAGNGGCSGSSVTGNYMTNGTCLVPNCSPTLTGNTFLSNEITGFTQSQYPSNTYLSSRPTTGSKVFVRLNQYEPGRGHVTIHNWASAATVSVDLSSILSSGQAYEIRNAQNYYGPLVATGTYSGGSVAFPTGALTPATPIGASTPGATGPKFNVYVVRATGAGGPTATPTKTATAAPPSSTPTRTATVIPPTATKTPLPGSPTPTPSGGTPSVYFEAESGLSAMPMNLGSDPLASGGVYVSSATANAGTATFTVSAVTPGALHYLWQRVVCLDDSGNSDSFFVGLDGENDSIHINDACEGASRGTSWQWRKVTDRALGLGATWARSLSAGSHTLVVRGREANAKLDRVAITTDSAWVPSDAPGPTATATVPPAPTTTPTPTRTPTVTPSNPPPTVCITMCVPATPTQIPTP